MEINTYIHPQLLLSLSDQSKRYDLLDACERRKINRPVGVVLGSPPVEESGVTSLFIGIEVTAEECINNDCLLEKLKLINEVYGQGYLTIVGVYSVSGGQAEAATYRDDDLVQLESFINNLCHNSDSKFSIIPNCNTAFKLVAVTFALVKEGFELHIKSTSGQYLNWEIRAILPEETTFNTLRFAQKGFDGGRDQVNHDDVIVSNLRSLDSDVDVMIKFVSKVLDGSINVSCDRKAMSELLKIVQVARKIQYIKNVHESESNEESSLEKIASLSSVCVSVLNENMHISAQVQKELQLLNEEVSDFK